jgi:ketosteroid isomerase-like protein
MDSPQLLDLAARVEITEAMYKVARSLDSCDWDLLRSVITDDIVIDMSSYAGESSVFGAEEWLARGQRLFPNLTATQHLLANPVVKVRGDEADCVMEVQAKHVRVTHRGQATYDLGGYYAVGFRRCADGRWRAARFTLTVTWEEGNPSIMAQAVAAEGESDGVRRLPGRV